MIPYGGFSVGEPARKTIADFQKLEPEALTIALFKRDGDFNKIFNEILLEFNAANDNRTKVGDDVVAILMDKDFWQMLLCWDQCEQDMVLTKLTYVEGRMYGEALGR